MNRANQRQGFLVSAVIHLTLLMMLLAQPFTPREPADAEAFEVEKKELVFLPRPEVLRQLVPAPRPEARPRPRAVPTPPPQPAEPRQKDRISVGPPTPFEQEGPLILRREDDLTKTPKGQMALPPQPVPPPPPAEPTPTPGPRTAQKGGDAAETSGREGLRLPPGLLGTAPPRGDGGQQERPPGIGDSVEEAVDDMSRRLAMDGRLGLPTGTGTTDLSGLRFDPQGADFTVWVNDFKNQVYRNWMIPQAAYLGYGGHVDFEFTLERDGSMSALRMLKSSGTSSLDRAARNALTSSRFMALPDDYGPPRVTMQVTFHYGPPRQS